MFTPVASPISFRKAVSVKSVPQPSVQRTTATEKVLSSASAMPHRPRTKLSATRVARILRIVFML